MPAWTCRTVALLSLGSACLILAGCGGGGENRKACFPVSGELFVGGQPAAGAQVVLFPKQNAVAAEWEKGFPRGWVDATGGFRIGTYETDDGAPPGEYAAVVTWPNESNEEEADSAERDRLRGRYADPAKSSLAVVVAEQSEQRLERWNLK